MAPVLQPQRLPVDDMPIEQKLNLIESSVGRIVASVSALTRRIDEWCDGQDGRRDAE